ncbi:hypothetical protein D3877_02240 [Azospirillum cavernae]|uniref:Uncharacterized protein n=1 Tax=Azospirillum cavernae TaxID=2320860 RepID=A0A418W0G2_9PROT|nr:hypothetical protein D3877_02240 [Azospirillum cavernae]
MFGIHCRSDDSSDFMGTLTEDPYHTYSVEIFRGICFYPGEIQSPTGPCLAAAVNAGRSQ